MHLVHKSEDRGWKEYKAFWKEAILIVTYKNKQHISVFPRAPIGCTSHIQMPGSECVGLRARALSDSKRQYGLDTVTQNSG
ncbi:hypothetical protein FKM82_004919 [Ascaphus truei]